VVLGKGKHIHALRECPNSFINEWSREMINLFHMCHSVSPSLGGPAIIPGPLPAHGGIFDQDNATMEAFTVIRSEMIIMAEEKSSKFKV